MVRYNDRPAAIVVGVMGMNRIANWKDCPKPRRWVDDSLLPRRNFLTSNFGVIDKRSLSTSYHGNPQLTQVLYTACLAFGDFQSLMVLFLVAAVTLEVHEIHHWSAWSGAECGV